MQIEMECLSVVNVAMQQNRVPVIRELRVTNLTEHLSPDVHVAIATDPPFASAESIPLGPLAAGETRRTHDVRLQLDPAFLAQLTERIAGTITVTITAADQPPSKRIFPIEVLPYDQWSGNNVLPELLAAFVTPNHPAIAPILRRAAEWLNKWTGHSALDAYQSRSANRVRQQMAAIYAAIAEQRITYASVPASFDAPGQRIRLADAVLAQKLGNCLDLSALFAACLEAAGIHPLIIIVKGHACAGGWLIPDTFPDSVTDDAAALTKRTADGVNELVVLDATALAGDGTIPFEQAVQIGHIHLRNTADFFYALDVMRCRFAGIRPLPQRLLFGDRWTLQEAPAKDVPAVAPQNVTPYDLPQTVTTVALTKQILWERKLLDLSLRNNLLNIRITRSTLQLISANLHEVEDALADGAEFRILPKPTDWESPLYAFGFHPSLDPTDPIGDLIKAELTQHRLRAHLTDDKLPTALTHLYRASRLAIEESGANTLYVALGMLRWFETPTSERPRFAPILLLPVEIIRKSAAKGYVVRARDEEPLLNITLLEMLRQNFNLTFSNLDPLPRDASGVDVRQIYTIIRHGIKNQRRWDVVETAMLGLFSFSTFVMWNDIHTHAAELAHNPIVASLMSGKIEWQAAEMDSDAETIDNTLSPAEILLPVPADSSQLEAVHEAVTGASFILHGPPGTGKSQTITNIIVNALYRGQRVLFVAEKMAALSVVEERLRRIGLRPFCLELHSNKVQKSAVLSQLKDTIDVVRHQRPEQFTREAERLFKIRQTLNAYVTALHRRHPFGLSLYEAIPRYLTIDEERTFAFPPHALDELTPGRLTEWRDAVEALASIGIACGHPIHHPLTGIGIADYSNASQTAASTAVSAWQAQLQEAPSHIAHITTLTGVAPAANSTALTTAQAVIDALQTVLAYSPASTIFSLDAGAQLKAWDALRERVIFPRLLGRRRMRRQIGQHLTAPPRDWEVPALLTALAKLHTALLNHVQDIPRLTAAKQRLATQLAEGVTTFQALHEPALKAFSTWRIALATASDTVTETLAYELPLPDDHETALEYAAKWLKHLHELKDWSRWIGARNQLIKQNIGFVGDAYIQLAIPPNALPDAFNKSFYYAAIRYAIAQDHALEMFKGELFNTVIEKYQALAAAFETLTRQELRARLSSKIPSFTLEAAHNSEVGILQRNIRNNGRGTPIRSLFDQISTLLPRICPCMLMSPMSVAQYIDVNAEPFDLVIFDEASQIPTSKAVGALARGKNVIIVGDPKQMPPTSFFAAQNIDEENMAVEDMESILDDCLALSIPSKYLLWHYRSQHESLIAFSNAEYYGNTLYTFPSPDNITSRVTFVPIDGCYDKGKSRTNRNEAQAIIDDIERRLSDPELRKRSIGVVTFSSVQQTLVEDLLGELFVKRPDLEPLALESAEPIFIKNLENVQGDERDIILFSICYGPDADGKVSMNFGPINREGGERRLNVAVSRARYEMKVFSTLQPDQIDLNRSSAAGVAGLKRFLEYAQNRTPGNTTRSGSSGESAALTHLIAEALRRRGHTVHTHVGTSRYRVDIAIVDPNAPWRYTLGILCDGDTYARAKTARDRELVQRGTLRRLGWRICRVWTMDWVEDPYHVLETLQQALADTAPLPPPPAPRVAPPAPIPLEAQIQAATVAQRQKRDSPNAIPVEEVASVLKEHLEQQISLPQEDLLRLASRTFGYARMGPNIEAAMLNGMRHAEATGMLKQENGRAIIAPPKS